VSEDREARLNEVKLEFAELASFLRDFMGALPIPVGFTLGASLEESSETMMHAADLIDAMPGLAPSVASAMRTGLQRTMGAMFALAWYAHSGGDWAYLNVRIRITDAGNALRVAGLGILGGDAGDGEVTD
jgi:hypothetical protein